MIRNGETRPVSGHTMPPDPVRPPAHPPMLRRGQDPSQTPPHREEYMPRITGATSSDSALVYTLSIASQRPNARVATPERDIPGPERNLRTQPPNVWGLPTPERSRRLPRHSIHQVHTGSTSPGRQRPALQGFLPRGADSGRCHTQAKVGPGRARKKRSGVVGTRRPPRLIVAFFQPRAQPLPTQQESKQACRLPRVHRYQVRQLAFTELPVFLKFDFQIHDSPRRPYAHVAS